MPKVNNTIRSHQLATIIKLVHDSRSLFGVIDKYFDRSYPLYYPGEDGPPYPDSYVTLSTIHQSKGSGFDTVFLLGTINLMFEKHGCFASPKKREEELLDMNVAVTRARHELHLLFPIDEQTWAHSKDDPNPWTFIRKANGKLYDLVRL
jgi:superfamily I DNA/RNA helicase